MVQEGYPPSCRGAVGLGPKFLNFVSENAPKSHRLILDALLWLDRTGAPWRDLPERFGPRVHA